MKSENLIVFFIPPKKIVNGGIMSIFSICEESRRFYNIHKSEVIISTFPGYDTYGKNDLFKNDEKIYSFDQIIRKWNKPGKLLLHIPENAVVVINKAFQEKKYYDYIKKAASLHINVLTQNIDLVSKPIDFIELFRLTPDVTQTTAHDKYTTQELSNKYQTPLKHLSTSVDQRQYHKPAYEEKENLIIYSPDDNPEKDKVIKSLDKIEGYKTQEVNNLSYEDYKKLTGRAKFAISFREGFDAYFSESYFSGSIGCAVYNSRFFPNERFKELPTVFDDYDAMAANLPKVIKSLDSKKNFERTSALGLKKMNEIQKFEKYQNNIKTFYEGRYDILPQPGSGAKLFAELIEMRNDIVNKNNQIITKLESEIAQEKEETRRLNRTINDLLNSKSWKVTKPLRKLNRRK